LLTTAPLEFITLYGLGKEFATVASPTHKSSQNNEEDTYSEAFKLIFQDNQPEFPSQNSLWLWL